MKLVLIACLLGAAVASPLPGESGISLRTVSSFLKGILSTNYGFQQVKTYIQNLRSDDPVAAIIRQGFESHSDEEWREVIKEFFKNTPIIAIEPGFKYPQLPELFGKVKTALLTDEGIELLKKYLTSLDTSNEILQGIVARLLSTDNEELKIVFSVLFSGISGVQLYASYDIKQDLEQTVAQVKAIVLKADGFTLVRETINKINSENPTLVLVKTVLSAMSDESLISLGKEISKNIPDVEVESPQPDLLDLVRKAKDLIITDDGIAYLRDYFDNLKTGNFLIIRVKNVLKTKTNEEVKADVINGWREIFGEEYAVLSE